MKRRLRLYKIVIHSSPWLGFHALYGYLSLFGLQQSIACFVTSPIITVATREKTLI